jgi:hypothetical protein
MSNERMERRLYRRSPGRQYGDDYEIRGSRGPGWKQPTAGQTGQTRWLTVSGSRPSTASGSLLTQRPDLRRTRQLLRQSILASKREEMSLHDEGLLSTSVQVEEPAMPASRSSQALYREPGATRSRRPGARLPYQDQNLYGATEDQLWIEEEEQEQNQRYDFDEGDDHYGRNDLQAYMPAEEEAADAAGEDPLALRLLRERSRSLRRSATRGLAMRAPLAPEEEPPAIEEEEYYEEEPPRRRRRILTRRRVLLGLGVAATGGAVVAATELVPKIPQAISTGASNLEHQLSDAFNRGFQAGADAVRKDFLNALENMEGVSLDAAMGAAKLLRTAYDVFVNPLVTLAANVAGDFLNVTLRAFIQARHWLANIGQDNSTLAALQNVLESWTQQANQMPKQIQAITDADLDGAQAYLRGLQRKIQAEQAKLNGGGQQATPPPSPAATAPKKS